MGKALFEIAGEQKEGLQIISMYDATAGAHGNTYFPAGIFKGFSTSKVGCSLYTIRKGLRAKIIILSHVNLLSIGWAIKKLSPSTKLVLLAHGIEIWKPLSAPKKSMLQCCDHVVAVSEYTRQQLININGVTPAKCTVINNCLDPFLASPAEQGSADELRQKYNLLPTDIVLFCLTRLAATERHKRYETIIRSLPTIQQHFSQRIVYVLAGKYTNDEGAFIKQTAATAGVEGNVVLTGFVPEEEIAAHFKMADVYVMPSSKEGFGLVFIEAMYYGLPVIAGNKDGSVDALANGELGVLVDPDDEATIRDALIRVLKNKQQYVPDIARVKARFGYEHYKKQWAEVLATPQ